MFFDNQGGHEAEEKKQGRSNTDRSHEEAEKSYAGVLLADDSGEMEICQNVEILGCLNKLVDDRFDFQQLIILIDDNTNR